MPQYTYDQLLTIAQQAGYQGAQAQAIAKQLAQTQGSTDRPPTDPSMELNTWARSWAGRIGKVALGGILAIGAFVLFVGPPAARTAGEAAATVEPAVRVAKGVEDIRRSRATRKLATGPLTPAAPATPQRTSQGGTLGEQPGNEPTTGGRTVKPTATPRVKTPRDPEAVAWARVQRERRKTAPNEQAALETWRAIATPEQQTRRDNETVRAGNRAAAGQREAPNLPVVEQRRQAIRQRGRLPSIAPVAPTRKVAIRRVSAKRARVKRSSEMLAEERAENERRRELRRQQRERGED